VKNPRPRRRATHVSGNAEGEALDASVKRGSPWTLEAELKRKCSGLERGYAGEEGDKTG